MRFFRVKIIRSVAISFVAAFLIAYFLIPMLMPLPSGLVSGITPSVTYTDRNGEQLRREFTASGTKLGTPVIRYDQLPDSLVLATLAAEDKRFFSHGGVDILAMSRALFDSIKTGRATSGASTITQQLVKISSPPRKRTPQTKLIEMLTARKLELRFSKQEILVAYLNRLPYGNQIEGCTAAAEQYFGKPIKDLSLAESALLAGLPNQPGRLNPYKNFAAAKRKQHTILSRLSKTRWIEQQELNAATKERLKILDRFRSDYLAPHFVELVRQSKTSTNTSLDLSIQKMVEQHINEQLKLLCTNRPAYQNIQAAAVVLDTQTSEVLALAGSRSFHNSPGGQLNGAMAARSAGSTLKPFTYLLAMEQGYTAATVLADTPIEYVSGAGAFQPVNFDRRYHGPVSLRKALATSLNIPAVKVLNDIGGPLKLHRLMRDQLGFTALHDNGHTYGLGLTIGNAEVRLLELANAYACLGRLGVYKEFQLAVSEPAEGKQVFNREHAWIMADILSDNAARSAAFGSDSVLKLPFPVAVKTGTSTDYRDNWVVSYTPEYTVAVWVGRFDNAPLPNQLTGAGSAGPIYHQIWRSLARLSPPSWYSKPETIIEYQIDELTGKHLSESFSVTPAKTRREYFSEIHRPAFAVDADYADGKTRLPSSYRQWWKTTNSAIKSVAALNNSTVEQSIKILSPKPGTVAYLDPDLPHNGAYFPLKIDNQAGRQIKWQCDTLTIQGEGTADLKAILKPGEHQLQVLDRATGSIVSSTNIFVERL